MEVDLTRFPLKIQLVNKIIQYNKHAILQLFICTTKAFCLRVNQTRKARDESKKKKRKCERWINTKRMYMRVTKSFYAQLNLSKVDKNGSKISVRFVEMSVYIDTLLNRFSFAYINWFILMTTVRLIELSGLDHVRYREIPLYYRM